MDNHEQLVKALRSASQVSTAWEKLMLDAAAAIEDMAKHITEMHERVTVLQIARGELEEEVKRIEPKRGEWVYLYDGNYKCSVCGEWYGVDETPVKSGMNYCPNCGADMRAKMEVQE